MVVHGFQGAASDLEKLRLTDSLVDAVIGELAVVATDQPCLIVGFNVEPTKIPCLLKGISAGLWFDLQACWATDNGTLPGATCKHSLLSTGGTRRDFVVGCPLATAAASWCRVLPNRWVMPHHAVRASFRLGTWTARSGVSVRYSALWPACWTRVTDRSRTSRSAEVRRIWEVYDEQLRHVPGFCRDYMTAALQAGNVSEAWRIWSLSAEVSLIRTYLLVGGRSRTSWWSQGW